MGLTYVTVRVGNPANGRPAEEVSCLVDSGAVYSLIPAKVLQNLARKYEGLGLMFQTIIVERLGRIELPHGVSLDQGLLRELRTNVKE